MSLKQKLPQEFYKNLDSNLKMFCRIVARELREEKDCVIAVTGYPGLGKSNDTSIIASLIDDRYDFEKNVCFIPTSAQIEKQYLELPKFSVLHIDEASRGLHKHKWQDRVQQKLNELFDTEREGHFLCTFLLMPRFQNFTENFRNFRIKYWINVIDRGLCIAYKRDEDKDCKDPWHLDENYKTKLKRWKGTKVFERGIPEQIKIEKNTPNYWFYFTIPKIPEEIWKEYQELKVQSRVKKSEDDAKELTKVQQIPAPQLRRQKNIEKIKKNYVNDDGSLICSKAEIARRIGVGESCLGGYLREIKAEMKLEKEFEASNQTTQEASKIFYNKLQIYDDGGKEE